MAEKLIDDGSKVKKAKLNLSGTFFFALGGLCFVISMFTETTVRADGMLEEPYFFLIPIGFLLLFISIILFVIESIS